ncbi:MAG: MOSC domain-containing protein, partial [Alcaligenaceae bacterium]
MPVRILSLHVFPIKSCAGIALDASVIDTAGLAMDRRWLLVDATGAQMTQRAYPRMALIQPAFVDTDLRLQAPGHEPFDLSVEAGLDAPHQEVTVWRVQTGLDGKIERLVAGRLQTKIGIHESR